MYNVIYIKALLLELYMKRVPVNAKAVYQLSSTILSLCSFKSLHNAQSVSVLVSQWRARRNPVISGLIDVSCRRSHWGRESSCAVSDT